MRSPLKAAAALLVAGTLVVASASPASAVSLSTTGAAGRADYLGYLAWDLFARDTLTDTHCAQWQRRAPGGSTWTWIGARACSSSEQLVATGVSDYSYRICRTGIGNCSAAVTLP